MDARLAGRVCIVAGVGGALGEAVARRFTLEGGIVVGIDRIGHEVGELALQADLAVEAEVRSAYAEVWRRFGRVDVLYNNAGHIDREDYGALDLEVEVWTGCWRPTSPPPG